MNLMVKRCLNKGFPQTLAKVAKRVRERERTYQESERKRERWPEKVPGG